MFIFGVIWFFKYVEDREDKKFYFYYNLGITKFRLFLFSFLVDFIIFIIIKNIL